MATVKTTSIFLVLRRQCCDDTRVQHSSTNKLHRGLDAQDEGWVGPHALILGTLDLLRRGEDGSVPHILAARGPFHSGLRLAIEVYGVYGLGTFLELVGQSSSRQV